MGTFTDTELELAPKVVEVMGSGRDYQKGDLVFNDGKVELHGGSFPCRPLFKVGHHWLPLEYDCLEWLREKGVWACSTYTGKFHVHFMEIRKTKDPATENQVGRVVGKDGETLLEALYRVIVSGGER